MIQPSFGRAVTSQFIPVCFLQEWSLRTGHDDVMKADMYGNECDFDSSEITLGAWHHYCMVRGNIHSCTNHGYSVGAINVPHEPSKRPDQNSPDKVYDGTAVGLYVDGAKDKRVGVSKPNMDFSTTTTNG